MDSNTQQVIIFQNISIHRLAKSIFREIIFFGEPSYSMNRHFRQIHIVFKIQNQPSSIMYSWSSCILSDFSDNNGDIERISFCSRDWRIRSNECSWSVGNNYWNYSNINLLLDSNPVYQLPICSITLPANLCSICRLRI